MTRHKTNATGQLRPLTERMSPAQLEARQTKREHRQLVSREHAITRGIAMTSALVLRRGFFGRLRWLLFGR